MVGHNTLITSYYIEYTINIDIRNILHNINAATVRTIIHAVLFGSKKCGNYGIIKIFTEQGLGDIKLLPGHIRSSIEVL